ncbi:hypothetical protein [Eisenbergiella sp.]
MISNRSSGEHFRILQRMDASVLIADKRSGSSVYISESCREQLGITEEILRPDVDKKRW